MLNDKQRDTLKELIYDTLKHSRDAGFVYSDNPGSEFKDAIARRDDCIEKIVNMTQLKKADILNIILDHPSSFGALNAIMLKMGNIDEIPGGEEDTQETKSGINKVVIDISEMEEALGDEIDFVFGAVESMVNGIHSIEEKYLDPKITPTDTFLVQHLRYMNATFTKSLFFDIFGKDLGKHLWGRYINDGLWRLLMKADLSVLSMLKATGANHVGPMLIMQAMSGEDASIHLWSLEDIKKFEMDATHEDFVEAYKDKDLGTVWWNRFCKYGGLETIIMTSTYESIYLPMVELRNKYSGERKSNLYEN